MTSVNEDGSKPGNGKEMAENAGTSKAKGCLRVVLVVILVLALAAYFLYRSRAILDWRVPGTDASVSELVGDALRSAAEEHDFLWRVVSPLPKADVVQAGMIVVAGAMAVCDCRALEGAYGRELPAGLSASCAEAAKRTEEVERRLSARYGERWRPSLFRRFMDLRIPDATGVPDAETAKEIFRMANRDNMLVIGLLTPEGDPKDWRDAVRGIMGTSKTIDAALGIRPGILEPALGNGMPDGTEARE